MKKILWSAALTLAVCSAMGCKTSSQSSKPNEAAPSGVVKSGGNLLQNPGFEQGRTGWGWKDKSQYWVNFEVDDAQAHAGTQSLKLTLEADDSPRHESRVAGVFQEIAVPDFPARIGGLYYVEELEKSDPEIHLYLQVAVIVWGAARVDQPNYQIRYYLAGQPTPALNIGNAKVEVVNGAMPEMNTWVAFDLPVRADFERLWGAVPEGYERVDVFFELRWDKMTDDGRAKATARYDDLFLEPYSAR